MPNTDHVAALQYAALILQRLARERSADASTARDAIARDVAQSEADAINAGSQALAALWREALGRNVDDDVRADHVERAHSAALRSSGRFTI